ncbi:MAG TPA: hypothetical protein VI731_10475 [Bacteroidia bacterium]|nr:hypothetical protein [Bacteroidia bacterium]
MNLFLFFHQRPWLLYAFVYCSVFMAYWIAIPLLILPSDDCYYHFNQPPFLIEQFYLDEHGHPDGMFYPVNNLIVLFVSTVMGFLFRLTLRLRYSGKPADGFWNN